MLANINANGLPTLPFLWRNSCTAFSLFASQAKWNPPSPLIATILPSRKSWRVFKIADRRRSIFETTLPADCAVEVEFLN